MKTLFSLLTVLLFVFCLTSCDDDDDAPKSTYVLVHGAWQAPYVWDAVSTDLKNNGHNVIVVQLPGHGTDNTAPHTLTIDVYRDKVIEAMSAVDGPVILVGHSMGGMVVTSVAEKSPSKISKLVYIGAYLPTSGQALVELVGEDADSQLGMYLIESEDKLTIDVQRDNLTRLFIDDGSQQAKDEMVTNYRAEPSIPLINPVTITSANFGSVNKVYIKTLQDIVISPKLQDRMIASAGITTVYTINTSHSPFLAQPEKVSELLLGVAGN